MTTLAQRNFGGGEISPALYPRCDLVKYSTGARTLRNFMIQKHGGAASRPGTQFVAEVSNSGNVVRLIPFVFNDSQTYVLEFGHLYMRVHQNGVQLTFSAQAISAITKANPAVVTIAAHGLSSGQEVAISAVNGMTQVNNRNFKITVIDANTFSLLEMDGVTNVDSTGYSTYTSGGQAARVYEITTPYGASDISGLRFVQSADVITITHPSYAPQNLSRFGDINWTIVALTFGPNISAPTGLTVSTAPGTVWWWVVTAVNIDTGDESLPSAIVQGPNTFPATLSWTAVSGAGSYNVYRNLQGIYGYVGTAGGGATSFVDEGQTPDLTHTPPVARNPFSGANNYPATVSYYQQRLIFANTNSNPETVWTSRSGRFSNFTISTPTQADDAITFTLVGRKVNSIEHLIDLKNLVILTSGGELAALGDANGVLQPTSVNTRQYSYHGAASLSPFVIGRDLLFLQARQTTVRSLTYSIMIDGYEGNDLTVFSNHLFDGYSIVDWAYAQVPNSIIWAARSDGTLLGLTYIKEQQLSGWHRHDLSGGKVENVCVVPEGNEDRVYLVVNRTIGGKTKRYIERMHSRFFTDIVDFVGMDAALTYDGRNPDGTGDTMTLTGGSGNWDYTQTLTLTMGSGIGSKANPLSASDVGNQIFLDLLNADGSTTRIRFTVNAFVSTSVVGTHVTSVVTGRPDKNVPAGLQGVATTAWTRAVPAVGGLWHLEGQEVSVFGDGFVVASPNNDKSNYPVLTVTNGTITLDRPYGVISVGLPYLCDIETLDIDTPQGEAIADKNKIVSRVNCYLENSRGLWVGPQPPDSDLTDPLQRMTELKIRNLENYDDPVALATQIVPINIEPHWNSNGRVFIRQVDPLPLTINAVYPAGMFPMGRS